MAASAAQSDGGSGHCPDCVSGSLHAGTPKGVEITLPVTRKGDNATPMQAYVVSPGILSGKVTQGDAQAGRYDGCGTGSNIAAGQDNAGTSTTGPGSGHVLLYFTDLFGWTFVNSRLLCDIYAAGGYTVLLADLHQGDSIPYSAMAFTDEEAKGVLGRVWKSVKMMGVLGRIIPWLRRHPDEVVLPLLREVAAYARTVASGPGYSGRVAAAGFCWGARYAVLGCGGPDPIFDAYVSAHPSRVAVPGDVEALTRPGLWCLAETDSQFKPDDAATTRRILEGRATAPGTFITYPGTHHGFAVRGGPPVAAQRAKCQQDVIEYLAGVLGADQHQSRTAAASTSGVSNATNASASASASGGKATGVGGASTPTAATSAAAVSLAAPASAQ